MATAFVGKHRFEKLTMNGSFRHQHPAHFGEYSDRLLEILGTDAAEGTLEGSVVQRQRGVAIQILHEPAIKPRIGGELFGVHAMSDDRGVGPVGRQVADPTRHEVEYRLVLGQQPSIVCGQRRHRTLVDVRDQPRRGIESEIIARILLGEGASGQLGERVHHDARSCSLSQSA